MSTDVQQAPSTTTDPTVKGTAKILEIGPYPPPYDGWSIRLQVLRKGLEEAGHNCVPLNLGMNRKTPSDEYECVRSGWEYLRKLLRYAWRGYTFHDHTNGDSPKKFVLDFMAYGASFLAFRRPILSIHAGTEQIYFPRAKSRLMVPVFKFLFGAAKAVICENPEVARCVIDYGISPAKVFVISPFTKQYLDQPTERLDDDLERFLDTHTPAIVTYLECREEYDVESLFWTVSQLARTEPQLGLLVVGASRERETISALLAEAGIAERSLHLGVVDHAVFLSLLRRVSLYLRCNEREGTSASIREALHIGVPVVANVAASQPAGIITYPLGDRELMLQAAREALASSPAGGKSKTQADISAIPDTVPEEVELLVRCALGKMT